MLSPLPRTSLVPAELVTIEDFDSFREVKRLHAADISSAVIDATRTLDEREELEPFIRRILFDTSDTPHGPAEIVDILTHRVIIKGEKGLAAFILKGRSYPTVRPRDVAHQIYRIEKIAGLRTAIFAAPGIVLDQAKEHFCSTAERLGLRYAIFDATDLGRLFVGYGFLCPRDGHRISAGRCRCGYSPTRRLFNVLQREALAALPQAHQLKHRSALVVLPTGSGKTRIAAEDARSYGAKRILYLAHTHEILDVAKSEFEAVFGAHNTYYPNGPLREQSLCQVNLATIQSCARRISSFTPGLFDYIVVDEFHHAAARTYRKVLDQSKPRFLLGLTATPFRGDRQDIAELCSGNIVVSFELRAGIEQGVLCPYHYYGCFDDVDYSQIKHNGASYSVKDLEKALVIPERNLAIVEKWKELVDGKATLAFCCSHKHAERAAATFRKNGIPAECYLSSTTMEHRRRLSESLQQGSVKVLCVVDVINEGADLPFVEALLFLRPTESKRIFFQQLGRGLRQHIGKSHCVVIDFIGNFKNAYRIVEYQGLIPHNEGDGQIGAGRPRNAKDVLNLPLGCKVILDTKVIDVFARQTLDPRHATRHNIGRILYYQYLDLARRYGRKPKRHEVNRQLVLGADFYEMVFGSWNKFEAVFSEHEAYPVVMQDA
jgi:superfamily II DNA or RNA helicase